MIVSDLRVVVSRKDAKNRKGAFVAYVLASWRYFASLRETLESVFVPGVPVKSRI